MRRRGALARRTGREWSIRGAVALALVAAGYLSMVQSIAWSQRTAAVERAHRWAPGDGRITAALSEKVLAPDADASARDRAARLARAALRTEPTAVAAAATLGLVNEVRGDHAAARRLFAYSQRMTRRDLRTQIWAIEDSVGRGDVNGALHHYDIALRTSRLAPDLLFPILTTAVADSGVRHALVATLAQQPPWTQAFLEYAAPNVADPRTLADLLIALAAAHVPVSAHVQTVLINGLVERGFLDQAWRYYGSIHRGLDRRRSRDPHFAAQSDFPSLLDWVPVNDAGISSSVQRGEQGGVFDYAAPPSVGGPLLRQMQFLPMGRYVLQGHALDADPTSTARPYWTLSCQDGRELGRVTVPVDGQDKRGFSGQFVVPPGCPVQSLTFSTPPSDEVAGVHGQIDYLLLRPAP